jgi:hypothetical protein
MRQYPRDSSFFNQSTRVRAGEKAFHILIPLTKKVEDAEDGKEKVITYGFKTAAVFGYSQTEGEPLKGDVESQNWIAQLPLIDVAKSWNLSVNSFSGERAKPLGYYKHGQAIALGVENLSTWTHELIHAADDKLGHLAEKGQHWASETVAELGGAILLECLGYTQDSDRGGCFQYIKSYAEKNGKDVLGACLKVFKRTCEAVAFALESAEKLCQQQAAAA